MSSILQTRVSPGNKTQPQLCEWDIAVRHLLVDPMSIAMRRLRHWIDDDGNKFWARYGDVGVLVCLGYSI